MIGLDECAKILFDGNDVVVPDGIADKDLIFLADSQSHGGGDNRGIWCNCSGQLNPDTWLGRSSAFAGGIPSLW